MDGHKVWVKLTVGVREHAPQFGNQLSGSILLEQDNVHHFKIQISRKDRSQSVILKIQCTIYLIGSKEKPLRIIIIGMDIVPDDWWPLQDRGHLLYGFNRDFVGYHFWT